MSSRERLITAMRYQEPDHVPLIFNVAGFRPPAHLSWSNEYEEAQRWLELGVDASIRAFVPLTFHPDVQVRSWEENDPAERWPVMVQEYHTPAGPIRQEVYRTDDWTSPDWPEHKDGLRLIDDFNVVRSRRFAVETDEDVERIKYLLWPPEGQALTAVREQIGAVCRQAEELGVLSEAVVSLGTDMVTWLCGTEGMILLAMDKPHLFEELLTFIHERDKRVMEVALESSVDLVVRRGWYEGTTFWSPTIFRASFLPRMQELADMAHQGDRILGYILSAGYMPLLDDLVQVGYDVHFYIDPIQGGPGTDLRKVKAAFDGRVAVVGGISEAITMQSGTREEIRQAVFDAIDIMAPGGGFILSPVDIICANTPWESMEILLEAWREKRDYPIR